LDLDDWDPDELREGHCDSETGGGFDEVRGEKKRESEVGRPTERDLAELNLGTGKRGGSGAAAVGSNAGTEMSCCKRREVEDEANGRVPDDVRAGRDRRRFEMLFDAIRADADPNWGSDKRQGTIQLRILDDNVKKVGRHQSAQSGPSDD
jgi:hypothetical protein